MLAMKNAVVTSMLDWMKTRERTDTAAAEEFAAAAVAGLKKITLELGTLQPTSSEDQVGTGQP